MGLEHGTYCVGCCWALMLLLFAGGVMNVLVIVGLTAFVAFEKLAPLGRHGAGSAARSPGGLMGSTGGLWMARALTAPGRAVDALADPGARMPAVERGSAMSWNLKGSYVETCSCELMCPCNLSFDHGATYDFCRVTLVFNIREGEIDGIKIGGLKVAAIADTPKVMTQGNWRLGVFVDEKATDVQFDKLVQVFTGQLGGPMAALAPLVGKVLGVERAAIQVSDDGLRHRVRVGDVIDFEIEDIVPSACRPAGRFGSMACFIRSRRISRWQRHVTHGSTHSASNTRERQVSRRRSFPGPRECMSAPRGPADTPVDRARAVRPRPRTASKRTATPAQRCRLVQPHAVVIT